MSLSTDVIVRKDGLTFPTKCVGCGKDAGGQTTVFRGSPVGFYGVIPYLFGATRKLEVPAHRVCGSKITRSLLIRNLSLVIGVTIVALLAIFIGLTQWQMIGLCLATILGPISWQVLRPLPFEFTYSSGAFKLMFLDPALAREVAELNEGELEDDDEEGNATEK